jgi:hypothetical protein
LQEKEACVARVRHEVESLQIVAPLLSEECGFNELTSQAANSTEETSDSIHASEATGTDGLPSYLSANKAPKLWRILKRKTERSSLLTASLPEVPPKNKNTV